jgi:uncharacterized protein YlxW (UPF0749 family)
MVYPILAISLIANILFLLAFIVNYKTEESLLEKNDSQEEEIQELVNEINDRYEINRKQAQKIKELENVIEEYKKQTSSKKETKPKKTITKKNVKKGE